MEKRGTQKGTGERKGNEQPRSGRGNQSLKLRASAIPRTRDEEALLSEQCRAESPCKKGEICQRGNVLAACHPKSLVLVPRRKGGASKLNALAEEKKWGWYAQLSLRKPERCLAARNREKKCETWEKPEHYFESSRGEGRSTLQRFRQRLREAIDVREGRERRGGGVVPKL